MALANVSTHDFDLFLSILYPTSFGAYPASTVEEWAGILHLADKWSFQSIRALSITQIAPIASPIDKIVFGRLYNINEWLTGAYHAVCTRPDALILEEGRRLGVDDVIQINAIRQDFCFVRVSQSASNLFEEDVESRFGLAIQMEHSTPAAVAKAKPTERQHPQPPTMGKQRSRSPTAGKSSKNSKKAGPLVLGDTTDVEPSALTPVDENSNETTLARALKGAGGTQGKVLREKEQSRIHNTSIGTAAENEVWSHLTAIQRWSEKKATIENERDAEERAELVKQMKQQLADEANTAAGGAAQEGAGGTSAASDGTNSVSIPEPNGTTGVSDTSTGAAASEKAFWSLLTPQERYREKMYKIGKEYQAEEHAERAAQLLKEAKQMMADEAKAAEEEEEVRRWSS
ncbi:hypothetical protein FIBSPDRAFT_807466 [Athelia psychrophila]|uniref:Uncharacterized protein n=1 Tax=Athelia psychrophila TaxID=1759441 RepID=A0A167UCE9_9AGAM|nr:hypothetical protein FIBSPDRAFT_807466 [Fibularhizoctonia sp. CBS 109695]